MMDIAALLEEATGGLFDPRPALRPGGRPAPVVGRVSVVCPTTDERALFHAQMYGCFASQRWQDKELVVIDTGAHPSPFLERASLKDERLVYRHYRATATAWSVGLKRNLAVHLASGQFIAHFDDDDLYAPGYLDAMVRAMGSADAVTLSSWFVCDPMAGLVGHVSAEEQESWVLGYGFSHVYLREAWSARPFPHEHFAEDYKFLLALRGAPGGRGVRTRRDDEGLVLHMQQGTNLSNSHAREEVPLSHLRTMSVAELPGFDSLLGSLAAGASSTSTPSSFLSVGEAFRMYLRPPPHRDDEEMLRALRAAGAAAACPPRQCCAAWGSLDLDEDHTALLACAARRRGERFAEPGRAFGATPRFGAEVLLPGDVERTTPGEHLALLHVARILLRRCPAELEPERHCEGWLHLQLRTLSHLAVVSLAAQFARHFPRVRLEVDFEPKETEVDPGRTQRELMLKALTEHGLHSG